MKAHNGHRFSRPEPLKPDEMLGTNPLTGRVEAHRKGAWLEIYAEHDRRQRRHQRLEAIALGAVSLMVVGFVAWAVWP